MNKDLSHVNLFYSNYSPNCKALLQYIKNLQLNKALTIKYINIDNMDIRTMVTKKFNVVPAIIVLLNDEVSLYTGPNVFEWFNLINENKGQIEPINDHSPHNSTTENSTENSTETSRNNSEESKKKSISEIAAEFSKQREEINSLPRVQPY